MITEVSWNAQKCIACSGFHEKYILVNKNLNGIKTILPYPNYGIGIDVITGTK